MTYPHSRFLPTLTGAKATNEFWKELKEVCRNAGADVDERIIKGHEGEEVMSRIGDTRG